MAWFEGLNARGKIKARQPLGAQGRIISGTNGRLVVDGPFAESKEAVGGYLVLQADNLERGGRNRQIDANVELRHQR